MNKKKVIIIVISILILLLAAGLIFFLATGKKKGGSKKTELFSDSDYPCEYKEVKDGLEITLDGSKTPGLSWTYEVQHQGIFEITPKGEEKNGRITYSIKVVNGGSTTVSFKRTDTLAGYSYDAANITLSLFALREGDGYEVVVSQDSGIISYTGAKVAETTEHPFIILTDPDGFGRIVFPLGSSDWMFDNPVEKLVINASFSSDGTEVYEFMDRDFFGSFDEEGKLIEGDKTGTAYETVVTISSEKLGLTEYVKVNVSEKGTVSLSLTDKPKDE